MAFADTLGATGTILNLPEGAGTTTIESKTNFIAAAPHGDADHAARRPRCIAAAARRCGRPGSPTAEGRLVALVTQTQLVLPSAG